MIKKISTHITFFTILLCVYILFSLIYSRKIDMTNAVEYYFCLTIFVFCFNLIKKRKIKWGIVLLLCFLLSYLMLDRRNDYIADNLLDFMFIEISHANIPFLPKFHINIDIYIIRLILLYLIYFWGALLYWYLVYRISCLIWYHSYICHHKIKIE
jgi:hypothetical protein